MLKKILSPEACEKCRVCCGFVEEDKWEIPLIFSDIKEQVENKLGIKLEKRGSEYVMPMEFEGDKLVYCPAASDKGCTLGEFKPFDCLIWPFRINSLGDFRVITVSPVCKTVSEIPLAALCSFIHENNFDEKLFRVAKEHPDMVKPYIDGYPILEVRKADYSFY